jgi:hypothetical protein
MHHIVIKSWRDSVGIVTTLRAGQPENWDSILRRNRDLFLRRVLTPVGSVPGFFPRAKAADHLSPSSACTNYVTCNSIVCNRFVVFCLMMAPRSRNM